MQGHADNIGPEDYNQILSDNRAKAVRDWLVRRGIAIAGEPGIAITAIEPAEIILVDTA